MNPALPELTTTALPTGPELHMEARRLRDTHHGHRITYSPKVFIPLTMLCRDRCGYCTFAQPPARLEAPYLSPEQILSVARRGAEAGCQEGQGCAAGGPPSGRNFLVLAILFMVARRRRE